LLVNKYKILSFFLVFTFSSWIWFSCDYIHGGYFFLLGFLLFLIPYYMTYVKFLKIAIIYKNILNIKLLFIMIFLLVVNMILTIPIGYDSYQIYVKILFYILLPFLFFFTYNNIYLQDKFLREDIKYIIFISFFWQIIFSFVIGFYDSHIGKIYENNPYFTFSSNELAIYMSYLISILGMIYFKYYNPKKSMFIIVMLLPFLHFSKSHMVFYFLSLLIGYILYKRKFLLLIFGLFLLISLSYFFYTYYDELVNLVKSEQIKKILLANQILVNSFMGNMDFNIWDFITKVGDGSRTKYFYTYFENLDKTFWLGFGDRADILLLNGADYHNMYFFFHIQYSFFAVIIWYGILLYFLYLGLFKWKFLNYFLIVSILYWVFKSLFSTMNPYIFLIYLLFLSIIEANLQKRIIKYV
jgi:hypothetical protein